jgi:serine phosphatase RsbU (regulator of sigma subunit)
MEKGRATIVVADDTDVAREVVMRLLKRFGYLPLEAADGVQALALVRSSKPDLLLCDLRMPNLDGLGLLKEVKQEFPELPVIVMSGEGLLQDAVGALQLGAWDYISKPFEPAALAHAIRKALEKAALIDENRCQRTELEAINRQLRASLALLAEEEDAGRQIQLRMLPRNRQCFGEYQFTRDVLPSTFLSGDFIDAFSIDDQHWGFYLADVSGHGVSSALVTVLLRTFVQRQVASYVRSQDRLILSPSQLLMRLNQDMANENLDKHLTIFYGIIDLRDDSLLYANAGHFPWPVLFADGVVTVLEQPGLPVGLAPNTRYEDHRLQLPRKVSLSVFSDGLLEVLPQSSLNEKLAFLQDFFGRPDVTVEQARRELHLHDGSVLPDDIAILIVQRSGGDHGNIRQA